MMRVPTSQSKPTQLALNADRDMARPAAFPCRLLPRSRLRRLLLLEVAVSMAALLPLAGAFSSPRSPMPMVPRPPGGRPSPPPPRRLPHIAPHSASKSDSDSFYDSTEPSASAPEGGSDRGLTSSMASHHAAVKTSNIEMALAFYSLLDYRPVARFRAGPARAAWLEHRPGSGAGEDKGEDDREDASLPPPMGAGGRLEVIEVPPDLIGGTGSGAGGAAERSMAADRMEHPALLGWDHICLDVTGCCGEEVEGEGGLDRWLGRVGERSQRRFGKALRIALTPRVRLIGRERYEVAFLYDADGGLIELVRRLPWGEGETARESGWDDVDDGRIIWRAS